MFDEDCAFQAASLTASARHSVPAAPIRWHRCIANPQTRPGPEAPQRVTEPNFPGHMGVSINGGTPKRWLVREDLLKMDALRVPLFQEAITWLNSDRFFQQTMMIL